MEKDAKIYVAGHRGLIGSALCRQLKAKGFTRIITRDRAKLDLTSQEQTALFFEKERPDYVFFAAAKVGGVYANNTYRAEFIYENILIQANVIHQAFAREVKKLIFFGCADMYPRECPLPAKEESILTGRLEPTCEPFAVAKLAGLTLCESYNRQYGTDFVCLIPPNVYGPNEHYDLMKSQVLPSLLKTFHDAKTTGADHVILWGTGNPVRDFVYVDDVADAAIFLMNTATGNMVYNIGSGIGHSIRELAEIIKEETGFKGELRFDTAKPDGVAKKLLDTVRLERLGWKCATALAEGVKHTYQSFLSEISSKELRAASITRVSATPRDKSILQTAPPAGKETDSRQPATYTDTVVLKPWGHEFLVFANDLIAVWFLFIKEGHATSMHCHPLKKTSLIVLNGSAMTNMMNRRRYLTSGDALIVGEQVFHSTKALSSNGVCLLEIETPPYKTDLIRIEDRYGREGTGYEGISEMLSEDLGQYGYFSFTEPHEYEEFRRDSAKYSLAFQVFTSNDDFQRAFAVQRGELYTSCRGRIHDASGKVLLDTGDIQTGEVLSSAGDLHISEKTVLLKTMTR